MAQTKKIVLICVALLLASTAHARQGAAPAPAPYPNEHLMCFGALASPRHQVPPLGNHIKARGLFWLQVNMTSGNAEFEQLASHIDGLTMTHLHMGNASTNGPVIVPLTPGTPVVNNALPMFVPALTVEEGHLSATAKFDAALFTGPLGGMDMDELVDAILEQDVYVNFHTVDYPTGIMRGQLHPVPCDEDIRYDHLASRAFGNFAG